MSSTDLFNSEHVKQALIDIDRQMEQYMNHHICKDISDNNSYVPVGLKFTNPDRMSAQIERDIDMDASDSKTQLPIVFISRLGIDTDVVTTPTWIPDELYSYVLNRREKTQHNPYPNVEYTVTRKPTDVQINYDIRIVSRTKKHTDILMERFVMHNRRHWGTGKYDLIPSYSSLSDSSNAIMTDTERLIRCNFSMLVSTKLSPAVQNNELIKKVYPLKAVSMVEEYEMSDEEFKRVFGGK